MRNYLLIGIVALGNCALPAASADATISMKYMDIMTQIESGNIERGTIVHIPPEMLFPIQINRSELLRLGCQMEIGKNSPMWSSVVKALKGETPIPASGASDVRWGVLLLHPQNGVQEIIFEAFTRGDVAFNDVFGYVNDQPVHFTANLPNTLFALTKGWDCVVGQQLPIHPN